MQDPDEVKNTEKDEGGGEAAENGIRGANIVEGCIARCVVGRESRQNMISTGVSRFIIGNRVGGIPVVSLGRSAVRRSEREPTLQSDCLFYPIRGWPGESVRLIERVLEDGGGHRRGAGARGKS